MLVERLPCGSYILKQQIMFFKLLICNSKSWLPALMCISTEIIQDFTEAKRNFFSINLSYKLSVYEYTHHIVLKLCILVSVVSTRKAFSNGLYTKHI